MNMDTKLGKDGSLLSHNAFAYCQNNPVMNSDPSGQWFETLLDIVGVVISFVNFISKPSWGTGATLAYDCVAAVTPIVPASSTLKVAKRAANTLKFTKKASASKSVVSKTGNMSRNAAFRAAKRKAGIPNSIQGKKPVTVYDTENRIVHEFEVYGNKKYIIEHREDKFGRGSHFHAADDAKGNPLKKGRYNEFDGRFPEIFSGYTK
ncbi:hypothetical protein HGI79_01815 [Clostridium sp. DJ247]|nr:hypothetical protein [Clostridium sp. DJ247]